MKLTYLIKTLPETYRRQLPRVILSVLSRSVLDFAGIATLFSVLIYLTRSESLKGYAWGVCVGGLFFLVVKNVCTVALSRYQSRYVMSLYRHFSAELFGYYHQQGLLFLRTHNTAELTHKVNLLCYAFATGVLLPLLAMTGECVLLLMLYGVLVIFAPMGALALPVCFLPLIWFYRSTFKKQIEHLGQEENRAKRTQSKIVQEAFKGYAEIEVNQAFGQIKNRFTKRLDQICDIRTRMESIQRIPTGVIEIAIAVALALLIGVGYNNTLLGIFALAAFRMLPAIRTILASWTQINNYSYTLTEIEVLHSDSKRAPDMPLQFNNRIMVKNLRFAYPDGKEVFSGCSFEILKGECIGFQGPSGTGKSTLFNLLLGFFEPSGGEILIDGTPLTPANRNSWHRIVGYVPQEVFIMDDTIARNIALGEEQIDRPRMKLLLDQMQLGPWLESLPEGMDTLLGENGCRLSGGQKQRIGIARALYKGAQVLFFDEATSALDTATEQEVSQAIARLSASHRDLTLLMIAHRDTSLTLCNRIITL